MGDRIKEATWTVLPADGKEDDDRVPEYVASYVIVSFAWCLTYELVSSDKTPWPDVRSAGPRNQTSRAHFPSGSSQQAVLLAWSSYKKICIEWLQSLIHLWMKEYIHPENTHISTDQIYLLIGRGIRRSLGCTTCDSASRGGSLRLYQLPLIYLLL